MEVDWEIHNGIPCVDIYRRQRLGSGKQPIILACGFGNLPNVFLIQGKNSLCSYLAENGYELWTYNIHKAENKDWSISKYIQTAAGVIEYVVQTSGFSQVHWIGHSMGGIIGLGLTCLSKPSSQLASMTTLGSAVFLMNSVWWYALNLTPIYRIIQCFGGVNLSYVTRPIVCCNTQICCCCCWSSLGCFDSVANHENTKEENAMSLLANSFGYEPFRVVKDFSDGFSVHGLHIQKDLDAPTINYMKDLIGTENNNIFIIFGAEDSQIPEVDVLNTIDCLNANTGKTIDVLGLGKKYGTQKYGHFDFLLGEFAKEDMFPKILEFLKRKSPANNFMPNQL